MVTREHLIEAVGPLVAAVGGDIVQLDDMQAGDVGLSWDGQEVAGVRLPGLHGALDRVVADVERELGCSLGDLDRDQRLEAVRMLDDRGAFTLRRAVERVADLLGVSRYTVYNYLKALLEKDGDGST